MPRTGKASLTRPKCYRRTLAEVIEAGTPWIVAARVASPVTRRGYDHEARSSGPVDLFDGVRVRVLPGDALLLQAEGDAELSVREGAALAPLSRRACVAALSERGGALHRLQAVRGDLPGPGHHHRGGAAAQRRHAEDHPLRHRHDEMHLLRFLPGGLPG